MAQWRRPEIIRLLLGQDVTIGLSVALGLFLIAAAAQLLFGPHAAAAAAVGVVVAIPPDQPAPRHGKLWQLLPAALIGPPLFYVTQLVRADTVALSLLLVGATFVAFLGAAWGKRGIPISMAIMFAMIFSLAESPEAMQASAGRTAFYMGGGTIAYVLYATAANALLNARYRALTLAETLFALSALMRSLATQFVQQPRADGAGPEPLIGRVLQQQAALADQLQTARNILLETPDTPRRQQLAATLVQLLDLRDHLLSTELDLDTLRAQPTQRALLATLQGELVALADRVDALADALLAHRIPPPFADVARHIPGDDSVRGTSGAVAPELLARGLVSRVGYIHDEVARLTALARGESPLDLDVVHANWQMFTSPTAWSLKPFLALWRWDAPPLRHALRAALAIGAGQAIALALPWGTHDYWILLTITVVLRGSFAQTIERRNHRVAGTLLGCVLAAALLFAALPRFALQAIAGLAQGIAHAFAAKRYFVTAVAATVLGLLQSYLLRAGAGTLVFDVAERIADTLIGAGIAWGASYLLPSWERTQIPALVARTLASQAHHARMALALGAADPAPDAAKSELEWRLARREAFDSLSALVQATQRSLVEPRGVRPALEPLGRLLAHSYQLLAQLTAIKGMLLVRRARLDLPALAAPLAATVADIESALASRAAGSERPATSAAAPADAEQPAAAMAAVLHDPLVGDLTPWLQRRLRLSAALATKIRADAAAAL